MNKKIFNVSEFLVSLVVFACIFYIKKLPEAFMINFIICLAGFLIILRKQYWEKNASSHNNKKIFNFTEFMAWITVFIFIFYIRKDHYPEGLIINFFLCLGIFANVLKRQYFDSQY